MRPWKHFGTRLSERLWPTAPTGRRSASAGNSLSISKPITTGAGSTALWGTNHLWNSKQQTTKIERTDSTKCVHKKGGREVYLGTVWTESGGSGAGRLLHYNESAGTWEELGSFTGGPTPAVK